MHTYARLTSILIAVAFTGIAPAVARGIPTPTVVADQTPAPNNPEKAPNAAAKPAKTPTPVHTMKPAPMHTAKPAPMHTAKPAPMRTMKPPIETMKPAPIRTMKPPIETMKPRPVHTLPAPTRRPGQRPTPRPTVNPWHPNRTPYWRAPAPGWHRPAWAYAPRPAWYHPTVYRTNYVLVNPRPYASNWAWNGGYQWYPQTNYWGGGFWGPFAAVSLLAGQGIWDQNYYAAPSYAYPGWYLYQNYGLQPVACGRRDLVYIYGPNNGVMCAYPNQYVMGGVYYVDPGSLQLYVM